VFPQWLAGRSVEADYRVYIVAVPQRKESSG
jgi:hypothetical protein